MLRLLMAVSGLFSPRVYEAVVPRVVPRTVEWADGRVAAAPPVKGTLRFDLFPYMRAPLDCLDDPEVEVVVMQFASRTGKTTGVQAWLLNRVKHDPHAFAWAEPDEPSLRRLLRRTWELIDATPELTAIALPPQFRSTKELRFQDCLVHGAWSGSPSKAADFAAPGGVILNECDKYSHRRRLDEAGEDAGEADFASLLEERTKGCPGAKVVYLSTPTVKGKSRVEEERLRGDRRRYYVPCPHCGHYQTLRTGDGKAPGGLRWEKPAGGKSDPVLARETAWYECEACAGKILDEHRYAMMNAGRWVQEGQRIDRRGRITGKPLVTSNRRATFGPLGTHYSLLPGITWGRIAERFVEAVRDPTRRKLRSYVNSWEGETWDPAPRSVEPHELVGRLGTDAPLRLCPEWSRFLTLAADVGRSGEELIFYWWACCWGAHARGQVVDYGITVGREAFVRLARDLVIPHADAGEPLRPSRIGVDAGSGTNQVYQLCEELGPSAWPLKGAAQADFPEWYMLGFKRADIPQRVLRQKQRAGAGDLCVVNTQRSQQWIEDLTGGLVARDEPSGPPAAGWFSVPRECCDDPDFLEQLLGDYPEESYRNGRRVTSWHKRGVNEWRDVARYSRVLAELYTRQGRLWNQLSPRTVQQSEVRGQKSEALQTPDGRPYFVLERK